MTQPAETYVPSEIRQLILGFVDETALDKASAFQVDPVELTKELLGLGVDLPRLIAMIRTRRQTLNKLPLEKLQPIVAFIDKYWPAWDLDLDLSSGKMASLTICDKYTQDDWFSAKLAQQLVGMIRNAFPQLEVDLYQSTMCFGLTLLVENTNNKEEIDLLKAIYRGLILLNRAGHPDPYAIIDDGITEYVTPKALKEGHDCYHN